MIQTSDAYKEMMKKPIRNRGYISITLGVVNQNAQGNASLDEAVDKREYSRGNLFNSARNDVTYGTLEENFTKADGKFVFLPRNDQYLDNGIVVEVGEPIVINLNGTYDIKGLTLEFVPTSYPTEFTIESDEETITVSGNTEYLYTSTEVFGDTTQITITPTTMSGGEQYVHLKRVLMGVGLAFSDSTIETAKIEDFVSGISIEASYKDISVSAFDTSNQFDVDNESAFINFLEQGQPLSVSFGVDLDDGTQEWFQVAKCRLKEWSSQKGRVNLKGTDLLTQSEKTYSHLTDTVRTAKSEFEAIFADMGLTPADYHIDDYLGSQNIKNPIEENSHRDCLQLLANATRAVIYEDENGVIQVKGSFNREIAEHKPSSSATWWKNVTRTTNEYGKQIAVSDKVASDSGIFADVSTTNLLDPESPFNTVEWLGVQPYLKPNEAEATVAFHDNYVDLTNESSSSRAYAWIKLKLKAVKGYDGMLPIKEEGWYSMVYSGTRDLLYQDADISVKMSGHDLEISKGSVSSDGSLKYFSFYVTQADLNADDLEIGSCVKFSGLQGTHTYTIGLIKKKFEWQDAMSQGGSRPNFWDDYYTAYKNPKITIISLVNNGTWLKFGTPIPQHIKMVYSFAGTINKVTEEYDVTSQTMYIPHYTDAYNVDVEIDKGAPLHNAIIEEILDVGADSPEINKSQMYEEPLGIQEEKVREVKVRIYTYEYVDGEYRQVDDEVYYTKTINSTGATKFVENPMIYNSAQAQLVAEWMASYYEQNVSYDVDYMGDPSIQANDIMYLDSDFRARNIVDVEKTSISFNGAFRGQLALRRMPTPDT